MILAMQKKQQGQESMMSIEQKKQEAETLFGQLPMPKEREEAWRHTSVERLPLEKFLGFSEPAILLSTVPEEVAEKGVVFCDMRAALRKYQDKIASHYLHNIRLSDKLIALAAAKWQNGVFLYVPKDVHVEQPLTATIRCSGNAALFTLIVMEKGASAQYLEEHAYEASQEAMSSSLTQVDVGENAQLDFHYLCVATPTHRSFSALVAHAQRNAKVNWFWGGFGGKLNRVRMDTFLEGNGASTENNGVFIGKGKEHLDATTNVFHFGENTTNNMTVNGIMKDSSSAIYRGLIKIGKNARGTNSYLSNHILKLSDKAIANSIPALEIDNNDVKASHGATVGQVDEEQLFYLRSRGLSNAQAEDLIVDGFFAPIVKKIPSAEMQERFMATIERSR